MPRRSSRVLPGRRTESGESAARTTGSRDAAGGCDGRGGHGRLGSGRRRRGGSRRRRRSRRGSRRRCRHWRRRRSRRGLGCGRRGGRGHRHGRLRRRRRGRRRGAGRAGAPAGGAAAVASARGGRSRLRAPRARPPRPCPAARIHQIAGGGGGDDEQRGDQREACGCGTAASGACAPGVGPGRGRARLGGEPRPALQALLVGGGELGEVGEVLRPPLRGPLQAAHHGARDLAWQVRRHVVERRRQLAARAADERLPGDGARRVDVGLGRGRPPLQALRRASSRAPASRARPPRGRTGGPLPSSTRDGSSAARTSPRSCTAFTAWLSRSTRRSRSARG